MGIFLRCAYCKKARLIYSQRKLNEDEARTLKRLLNDFRHFCRTALQEMIVNEHKVLVDVFARGNLSCTSNIEGPYYSCKVHEKKCIYSGEPTFLLTDTPEFFPQCRRKDCVKRERVKISRRRKLLELSDKWWKNNFDRMKINHVYIFVLSIHIRIYLISKKILFPINFSSAIFIVIISGHTLGK